jgi:hypothetical protein
MKVSKIIKRTLAVLLLPILLPVLAMRLWWRAGTKVDASNVTVLRTFEYKGYTIRVAECLSKLTNIVGPSACAGHGGIWLANAFYNHPSLEAMIPAVLDHEIHHIENDLDSEMNMGRWQYVRYMITQPLGIWGIGYHNRIERAADNAAVVAGNGQSMADFLRMHEFYEGVTPKSYKFMVGNRVKVLEAQGFIDPMQRLGVNIAKTLDNIFG